MIDDLFYELKPLIFLIVGFYCATLDHPVKWLSFVMFVTASFIITKWRLRHRNRYIR